MCVCIILSLQSPIALDPPVNPPPPCLLSPGGFRERLSSRTGALKGLLKVESGRFHIEPQLKIGFSELWTLVQGSCAPRKRRNIKWGRRQGRSTLFYSILPPVLKEAVSFALDNSSGVLFACEEPKLIRLAISTKNIQIMYHKSSKI